MYYNYVYYNENSAFSFFPFRKSVSIEYCVNLPTILPVIILLHGYFWRIFRIEVYYPAQLDTVTKNHDEELSSIDP